MAQMMDPLALKVKNDGVEKLMKKNVDKIGQAAYFLRDKSLIDVWLNLNAAKSLFQE